MAVRVHLGEKVCEVIEASMSDVKIGSSGEIDYLSRKLGQCVD
jgi:hypothetical protein